MYPTGRRTTYVPKAFMLVLVSLLTVVSLAGLAGAVNHGAVVPETPRTNTPKVLDGKVYAHAQVGSRIYVGGNFQQVELPNGTVVDQAHLFAYDINTGAFDTAFTPDVSNVVRALEPTPNDDGLYVGGLFTRWDNSFPLRIAKLDASGNLDTSFNAAASARVMSISARSDTIFIAGDFNTISGSARVGLAALDAQTGAVDPGFVMNVADSVAGSSLAKTVELTPDGNSLFALHYGDTINGVDREAVVKVSVGGATATLADWRIEWDNQAGRRVCRDRLRDLAMDPAGAFIVIGGQGADNPPNCDSVLRYETSGTGAIPFTWSARMYSSVFSLAVSDVAVYVGGHFCAAPKNPIPVGGVSSTWTGTANGCDVNDPTNSINPSQRDPNNAVFRKQMAALNPTTGQALSWDPGSNNFLAVFDLTLIDRGLLAGHDADRFNQINVGRSGFFDFGGAADTQAPTIVATDPVSGAIVTDPTQLAGTASDNQTISSATIRVKRIDTDEWLQADGTSFGPNQVDLPVTFTPTGLGSATWSTPVSNLPSGSYEIRGFSTDAVGNTSTPLGSPFTIPGDAECSVTLDGNDQPVIAWSNFEDAAVNNVVIRRDGVWQGSRPAPSGTYVDATATPGDYSYIVRWRPGGVITDVACTPDPFTVPDTTPDPVCTVVLDAGDKPFISWSNVPNNTVSVRETPGGFIASITGTSFTDVNASTGDHSYLIRYSGTDVPCTPQPITVPGNNATPVCSVVLNENDQPVITWSGYDGVNRVSIRRDGGWIAARDAPAGSYTDTAATPGDYSYAVRWKPDGTNVDVPCTPTTITVPEGDPGDPLVCTVVLQADNSVRVDWTAVEGINRYVIRTVEGGWIGTAIGGLTYTDGNPDSGEQTYRVRYKVDGVNFDTDCTPDPIVIP